MKKTITLKKPLSTFTKKESTQSIQDLFIHEMIEKNVSMVVFLVNGIKLEGNITHYDQYCIILQRNDHKQLIYKHSVSTIMPLNHKALRTMQLENKDPSSSSN